MSKEISWHEALVIRNSSANSVDKSLLGFRVISGDIIVMIIVLRDALCLLDIKSIVAHHIPLSRNF